jgi:hypothetical protein
MFFFFSNRLGCLGSLLVSAVVTVVLLFAFGMLRLRLVEILLSQRTTAGDRYPMSKEVLMIPADRRIGLRGHCIDWKCENETILLQPCPTRRS